MKFTQPLQGILFDFDGLILDTETPIFQAWERKFREYGHELILEEWAQILGKSNDEMGPLEGFLENFPDPAKRELILEEVKADEQALIQTQGPLPGVVDLINKAGEDRLKMGIVSSSDREWVHTNLERLGLLDYFDHTSCADDVENAKPDPSLYHLGLKKMGLSPDRVVVLEDSPFGVLAAKRAGLFCIAVLNQLTAKMTFFEDGGAPDMVLSSLEDFPWKELMRINA
jgi:HAD superfamily hydrolase (TIGR01509 family)